MKNRINDHEMEDDLGTARVVHYNPTLRSNSYIDRHSRNSSPSETPIQPHVSFPSSAAMPSAAMPSERSKSELHSLNNGHVATGYHSEVVSLLIDYEQMYISLLFC